MDLTRGRWRGQLGIRSAALFGSSVHSRIEAFASVRSFAEGGDERREHSGIQMASQKIH